MYIQLIKDKIIKLVTRHKTNSENFADVKVSFCLYSDKMHHIQNNFVFPKA